MSKEVFIGIVDFIVTKNEKENVELKILEKGPYDSSGFDKISVKYYQEGKPPILDRVFSCLEQNFENVYIDRGPFSDMTSWKEWSNCRDIEGPSGYAFQIEPFMKKNQKLRFYSSKVSQNGILWLHPLARGIDGECYARAHRLNQQFKDAQKNLVVAMASPGCVAMATNKGILKRILEQSQSSLMPPTCLLDLVKIDNTQLEDFLQKTNTDYFIFKPTHATLSEGIILAKKEDVGSVVEALQTKNVEMLKQLLKKCGTPENKLKEICDYWLNDKDNFVLIQSYCFAASIREKDKNHENSKGRAVICVKDNKVHVIDIFFHAPKNVSAENKQFNYTQCVIGGEVDTEFFNPDDSLYAELVTIFERELPSVFEKAYDFDLQTALLSAIEKNDESEIRYLLTSCKYLPVGEYSDEYLEAIKKNLGTSPRGLLFLDFLVAQTKMYVLGNEDRKYYHSLFDMLRPNISLLNKFQIDRLLSDKYFVLSFDCPAPGSFNYEPESTEEFKPFFEKLEERLKILKATPMFSSTLTVDKTPKVEVSNVSNTVAVNGL